MGKQSQRIVRVAPRAPEPVRLPEPSFTAQPEAAPPAVQARTADVQGHDFGRVSVHPNVLQPSSGGHPLPGPVQRKMESAFGQDFSAVRIHQGPEASSIGATAFTRGTNIHFAPGRYDPQSREGQRLLGHELTHVVQQRAGKVAIPQGGGVPINADRGHEAEADAAGAKAAAGKPVAVTGSAAGVQRKAEVGGGGVIQCEGKKPARGKNASHKSQAAVSAAARKYEEVSAALADAEREQPRDTKKIDKLKTQKAHWYKKMTEQGETHSMSAKGSW